MPSLFFREPKDLRSIVGWILVAVVGLWLIGVVAEAILGNKSPQNNSVTGNSSVVNSGNDAPSSTNSPMKGSNAFAAADKFAMDLQRTFKNNGYDIDARIDIDKSLVVTSDIFKDASAREAEVDELGKERVTLCSLDIWYVKVGYSNGLLSSDVSKNISLGCPEEKALHEREMAPERAKAAAQISIEGVHASVAGTTLLIESDFFSESSFRSQFMQKVLGNPEVEKANCRLGFTLVKLTYKSRVVKSIPIRCE
jgi:hypothetical protein